MALRRIRTRKMVSDDCFFTSVLDTSIPELEHIGLLYEEDKISSSTDFKAKKNFASYVRRTLQPELYFSCTTMSVRRSFFKDGESWQEAADRIVQGTFISAGTPCTFTRRVNWESNPTANDYSEWTWQFNRHHDWQILAYVYLQTGDEKYAQKFAELLDSWITQARVPLNASGDETLCWRTIEAAIRMKDSWSYALHAFIRSPVMTDERLVSLIKSIWEHGQRLRSDHREANWLIMEMNALAQIGILYPWFVQTSEWLQFAMDKLKDELALQVYPDGFQYELSTGYHQAIIQNYVHLGSVCHAYGVTWPAVLDQGLEQCFALNLKLMMPDGRLPDLNDGDWLHVDKVMQRAVAMYPEREDFRWAASRGAEGQPPGWTSVELPYSGFYIFRSGWNHEAIWGLFDGGPFGRAHQHEDQLNLLIHAYGKLLLTEAGNYAYDHSPMREYVLSTRAHNTVRVDGKDQNRRLSFRWQPEDIHLRSRLSCKQYPIGSSGFKVTEAVSVYQNGYGDEHELHVIHERRVLYLKGGEPSLSPFFVVVDTLTPADEQIHEYEILWHANSDQVSEVTLNTIFGLPNEARLMISSVLTTFGPSDDEYQLQLIRGQEQPIWQGWRATGQGLQGQYEPATTACYRFKGSGLQQAVTLLYPIQAQQHCPIEKLVVNEVSPLNENPVVDIQLNLSEWTNTTIYVDSLCLRLSIKPEV